MPVPSSREIVVVAGFRGSMLTAGGMACSGRLWLTAVINDAWPFYHLQLLLLPLLPPPSSAFLSSTCQHYSSILILIEIFAIFVNTHALSKFGDLKSWVRLFSGNLIFCRTPKKGFLIS